MVMTVASLDIGMVASEDVVGISFSVTGSWVVGSVVGEIRFDVTVDSLIMTPGVLEILSETEVSCRIMAVVVSNGSNNNGVSNMNNETGVSNGVIITEVSCCGFAVVKFGDTENKV
jgi:hypothetical protein